MTLLPIIVLVFVLASFVFYAIFKKKMQYWIMFDVKRGVIRFFQRKPKDAVHIMFCLVDHFEPGNGDATPEKQKSKVDAWIKRYPKMASKHKDSDGICPKHTFFFPPHYDTHDHLEKIAKLCSKGYGEVEMHLHHDRHGPWPDDEISLENKILECIERYSRYGIFCLPEGRKAYAFIHGDWALANSLKGERHCGVNDEISILLKTGCYADFTFPVSMESQPKSANTIFYAKSSASHPKSYNEKPVPVNPNANPIGKLMLIQGIIGLRWKSRVHKFLPSIEQSNIDIIDYPFPSRIDYWVKKAIGIENKKNWIFVKIHTHGAGPDVDKIERFIDKTCDDMFSYLESKYNCKNRFFLHYVSAREMYNIVKAAESGLNGNPHKYRDFSIPRYLYLSSGK